MKKIAMLTLAILFSAGFAFAVPESFSQEYILSKVQSHELVQQAQVNLAIKTGIQTVEAGWKGAQVTLTPAFTYDDLTGEFDLRETAIGGDLLFPLGISKADKERKIQTAELAAIAEAELSDAYGKAYTDLFALYGTAYSTQQNVELAEAEAELARLRLASISQKIARGLAALSEQTDAEAEYQAAEEKSIQAGLDARITYFNLAYAAGLEIVRPGQSQASASVLFKLPHLEKPDLGKVIRDLAQPGILMAIAKNRSPAVQAQKQKVISARRDLDGQSTADLNLTPKLSYASPSVSSAIGYGSLNGTLSLGADWKPYVNEEAVNKSAPADNSLTFSIGISGNFSPTSAAQKASLAAAVRLEELKLTAIEQSLDLLIRSRYASYLKAKDSVAEAERAKIVATEISAAARAKAALGQLSPEDIAANEVLVLRSAYTAEKASIALGQAYLALISASNAWDTERFPINGVK